MTGSELLLTIDTSTPAAGIAISRGETLLGEVSLTIQGSRTDRLLLKTVANLFEDLELRPQSFAAFAAVIGPGSFTGLRVGVATIKGLAMAMGRPVLGVSALRMLAMQAGASSFPVCALLDARKKEVYAALYLCLDGLPMPTGEEMVLSPEALLDRLPEQVLFVGNGVAACRPLLEARLGTGARFLPWSQQSPRAGHAAALALAGLRQGEGMPPALLLPHYIRRSEAELLYDRGAVGNLIEG